MKKLLERIQKTFAAVSFAEADEHDTARDLAGLIYQPERAWQQAWDRTFASAAFAEADCADLAQEFMTRRSPAAENESLDTFLEAVGLKGVRVCYVLARV